MSLHHVFNPASIAVIGASSEVGSVGNDLVKNLAAHFKGQLYPVNLKGDELYGKKVYRSVTEVPGEIELAIIAVPASVVMKVFPELGQKKIPAAVVISAGFREAGQLELETQLVELAAQQHITLIGPNCLGVINPYLQMNASFAPTMPSPGGISFLSQSGALGSSILDYAAAHELGFAKFLSLGNKAAVGEADLLAYLAADDQTKVILLYAEQLTQLEAVLKAALEIRKKHPPKPIIILKSGQTEAGMRSAQSHTGALAGSDAFYEAMFREAGIIRAESVEELFLYAECFLYNSLPNSNRVGVVTNAGGVGVLVTDAIVHHDLTLAEFSQETQQRLSELLPPAASTQNPVDILGDAPAQRYAQALELVLADPAVDAGIILLTPQSMTEVEATAQAIVEARRKSGKPIVVNFLGGALVAKGITLLEHEQVAESSYPELTAKGLGVLRRFALWQENNHDDVYLDDFDHPGIERLLAIPPDDHGWLDTKTALEILAAAHIPVAPWQVVGSVAEVSAAVELVAGSGGQVVLKVLSPQVLHKSDLGAIALGVTNVDAETKAQTITDAVKVKLPQTQIHGILVMQQVMGKQKELLIGAVRNQQMGAIVGCGLGGIYTETFHDATFELLPLRYQDSQAMISRLKIAPLFDGARGQVPLDRNAFSELIDRVAFLVTKYPQIAELDINPLFVKNQGEGVVVADVRIRIFEKNKQSEHTAPMAKPDSEPAPSAPLSKPPSEHPNKEVSPSQKIHAIFASTSGNVESVVEAIAEQWREAGWEVETHRSEVVDPALLEQHEVFLFATSTWDHGIMNPYFLPIYDAMEKLNAAGKRAFFVGCGDVRYEMVGFNAGIQTIHDRWLEKGGEMLHQMLKLNGDPALSMQKMVIPWAQEALKELRHE